MERLKLRARIIEKYGTIGRFCASVGISPVTVTNVLAGRTTPHPLAIIGWCHVLSIPEEDAAIFFTREVAETQRETR